LLHDVKITELCIFRIINQDVFWLDVAVQDVLGVEVLYPLAALEEDSFQFIYVVPVSWQLEICG
jgi:hypothetical protein